MKKYKEVELVAKTNCQALTQQVVLQRTVVMKELWDANPANAADNA